MLEKIFKFAVLGGLISGVLVTLLCIIGAELSVPMNSLFSVITQGVVGFMVSCILTVFLILFCAKNK